MNMENNINKPTVENFTYELIERIVRFICHLEDIENQFYRKNSYKLALIDNYKCSLKTLLDLTFDSYRSLETQDNTKSLGFLQRILHLVNELHTKHLAVLPRPSEPIELTRFERVIRTQVVKLADNKKNQDICVSMYEKIGEEVQKDQLHAYKEKIQALIEEYNLDIKISNNIEYNNTNKLHISIPRIDTSNTFRWPSLLHEVAHSLLEHVNFESGDLTEDFKKFIDFGNNKSINEYFVSVADESSYGAKLSNWLRECWCDLFACILIGPSLYFSQYLAFLNEEKQSNTQTHPPIGFRMDLIEAILTHRFPKELKSKIDPYILECDNLITAISENVYEPTLTHIYNTFNGYFANHFFEQTGVQGNPEISKKLKTLITKYININSEVIDFLVQRLNDGLPIPIIKIINHRGCYEEIPTYVQEIFLASWVSRIDILRPKVLKSIKNSSSNRNTYQAVKAEIIRHDQSVLKSIQVSEWVELLIDKTKRPDKITVFKAINTFKLNATGTLVDKEIKGLIESDELKIIPLIHYNLKSKKRTLSQIGTTSIDVRLGTNFQMFYPDQYGIIDFTEIEDRNPMMSSKRVTLDFIEGITIAPGQFLLGHSMEYVKLPDYVCGNLEGRSSFARLGIEIHMTAGYIDPGFEGVITFEIYNAGPSTVKLYPGMRIGQLRFDTNNLPATPYSKKHTVKYKGLLEHDLSRQNRDVEVELIKKYKLKCARY